MLRFKVSNNKNSFVIFTLLLLVLLVYIIETVNSANPNYSYHVKIQDPVEANYQEKAETRKGDFTEGFYSVVEPNGALRTVTYTADEWGFKPTITYSYGHPVPPVKKVLTSAVYQQPIQSLVHSVPSVSYQQLYSPPAGTAGVVAASSSGGYANVNANGYTSVSSSPYQYANSYAAPFVSVKETRTFVKSPQAYVQPVVPSASVYQAYAPPSQQQYVQYASPVVQAVQPAPVYGPPPPSPSPTPEYLIPPPSPSPTPEYLIPPPSPSPSPVYYQPPPSPAPTVYLAPSSTPATSYLPPAVEIRGASKSSGGYDYPAPSVQLEFPSKRVKVKRVKVQRPNGEYLPPPPEPSPTPAPVYIQPPAISMLPPPAVQLGKRVQAFKQVVQTVNYAQPIVPLVHKVHYTAPTLIGQPINYIQPQPLVQKIQYAAPAPIIQKIQYSPANAVSQQYHISRSPQPAPAPVINYAQHVQSYEAPPEIQVTPSPPVQVVQNYEDVVYANQHVMRYAETPVLQYAQQPAPVAAAVAPPLPAIKGAKQNPLTFNYGYDNGVSKVSHSYYGSGW